MGPDNKGKPGYQLSTENQLPGKEKGNFFIGKKIAYKTGTKDLPVHLPRKK